MVSSRFHILLFCGFARFSGSRFTRIFCFRLFLGPPFTPLFWFFSGFARSCATSSCCPSPRSIPSSCSFGRCSRATQDQDVLLSSSFYRWFGCSFWAFRLVAPRVDCYAFCCCLVGAGLIPLLHSVLPRIWLLYTIFLTLPFPLLKMLRLLPFGFLALSSSRPLPLLRPFARTLSHLNNKVDPPSPTSRILLGSFPPLSPFLKFLRAHANRRRSSTAPTVSQLRGYRATLFGIEALVCRVCGSRPYCPPTCP